jgi:serine/threonine protein kinase
MPDRVGQQLGNYRLIRLLGEGGFAEVYLGEHIHLGTEAAIKILSARLSSDEIEQFRNEARTIAHLKHPHIVRILDFGVGNGTPFLVMDYVANGTLRQRFPRGTQLPPETILPFVTQIAAALQYAHDQKLIHRDVKPENMLLEQNNHAMLSDFGIAIVAHSSRSLNTQDQSGTLPYMAPEQLQGKPRFASDQYALGVVVYEWLTGTKPFNGMSWEIVSQHFSTPPPLLREKVPMLSSLVEQVVLKALEKNPHQRFESIREFAQAFASATKQAKKASNVPTNVVKPLPSSVPLIANVLPSQAAISVPQGTTKRWRSAGIGLYKARRHREAIAAYNEAIALDPKYALAYYNRGAAYRNLKEYELAIADHSRAIELNPKHANAYGGRGVAYYYLKDYQHAVQDFDRALQLDPSITWFKSERDNAYRRLKRKS